MAQKNVNISLSLTAIDRLSSTVNSAFGNAMSKITTLQDRFSSLKSGGGLTSALGLGGMNPYALAGAGIASVTAGAVQLWNVLSETSKELGNNSKEIQRLYDITGESLSKVTANASVLAVTFNKDFRELSKAGNSVYREFGVSASESMRLVEQALIATNGAIDLDYIHEYSTQLKQAGLTAQETFAIATKSANMGIYQDKALDAIKEANLRLTELPKTTKDALMNIEKAGEKFKIGDKIFDAKALIDGLSNGKIKVFDAVKAISKTFDKINPQARAEAIANIFGGPGEDAGIKFFQMLNEGNLNFDEMTRKSNGLNSTLQKRLDTEKQIAEIQLKMAPAINATNAQFELLTSQAKLGFYETLLSSSRLMSDIFESLKSVDFIFGKLYALTGANGNIWELMFGKWKDHLLQPLVMVKTLLDGIGLVQKFIFGDKKEFQTAKDKFSNSFAEFSVGTTKFEKLQDAKKNKPILPTNPISPFTAQNSLLLNPTQPTAKNSNTNTTTINYTPNITIAGTATEADKRAMEQQQKTDVKTMARLLEQETANKKRKQY